MSDRVQIQITATDGASRVFANVASSADKMDQSLDKAGKTGIEFSKVGAAIGASLGVAVIAFGEFGRAAAESEAAQARVETAVESTGAAFDQYAEQIQAASNQALSLSFDDEDALDAISAITTATGNAAFAIDNLGLVMDIARGRQIDLAAASKIVIAAEQGRFGSLKRLGIVLDENATKEEALAALQGKYAGQAEAYAETSAGAMDRWRESLENVEEAIGAHSEAATSLALVAQTIGPAFTLASTAIGGFGKALAATKLAAVPAPLLAIAAAAGLVYVGWEALHQQGDVTSQGLEDLRENAESVEEVLTGLAAAGESVAMSLGVEAHAALSTMASDIELMLRLSGEQATAQPGRMDEAQRATHEAHMARLAELEAQYGSWTLSAEEVAAAEADLQAVLTNSGTGRDLALQGLERLNAEYAKGNISHETYISGLENIADSLTAYDMAANRSADGTAKLTDAQKELGFQIAKNQQTLDQYLDNRDFDTEGLASEHRETAAAIEEENEAREHGINTAQVWMDVEQRMAANAVANAGAVNANIAMYETMSQAHALRAQQVREEAIAVEKLKTAYVANFEAMQAHATQASDTLDTVFGAIVGNTDAIADNAQGVADWAAGIAVATEHFDIWGNSLGWWSVADDLVYDATITQQEYNDAVEANTDIQAANASIQRDVLSIQAQLAPVIATATEALATQMDEIANGSTDAQLFALGMMDATTSSQALALAQGYLSDQDTFGPMIQQAAELNPMLAQILEEMGLISYNPATGVVELLGAEDAVSELDQLTAALDRLTMITWMATLDADATEAEAAFEEATGLSVDWDNNESEATLNADNSDALADTDEAITRAGYFDNYTATADLNVNDNASGQINAAIGAMNQLDGMVSNSYINTYVTTISSFIGSGTSPLGGRLGGVLGYANGGVIAQLAEAGPEMLHFRDGGTAMAWNRGYYNVPQGTLVDTAPATAHKLSGMGGVNVVINVAGSVGVDDLSEQVSRQIVPAIQRAMREHERSLGGY